MNMRHLLWIPGLLAFCVLTASAQQETTEPEEALTPQQQAAVNSPEAKKVEKDLSQQVAAIEAKAAQQSRAIDQRLNEIDKTINTITKRLGDSYTTPTSFNSVERRIGDIEKRLDRMERELRSASRR
mgnify:CR=1 FL=1